MLLYKFCSIWIILKSLPILFGILFIFSGALDDYDSEQLIQVSSPGSSSSSTSKHAQSTLSAFDGIKEAGKCLEHDCVKGF